MSCALRFEYGCDLCGKKTEHLIGSESLTAENELPSGWFRLDIYGWSEATRAKARYACSIGCAAELFSRSLREAGRGELLRADVRAGGSR